MGQHMTEWLKLKSGESGDWIGGTMSTLSLVIEVESLVFYNLPVVLMEGSQNHVSA